MALLVPSRELHGSVFESDRCKTLTATFPEKYKNTRCVPLANVTARTANPRPTSTSYSGPNSSVYPDWHEPRLIKTPWELERHKKSWRRSKTVEPQLPAKIFKPLPKEVYEAIVAQLEHIHLDQEEACQSCYLKDLHSLSLVGRAWDRAATPKMYSKVILLTSDEHSKLPRLKLRGTGRIKLLRRTLRERTVLARCVHEIHLSGFQTLYETATIEKEELVNQVASLVMACPHLERLVGFHILYYTHAFDRLSNALSTRVNMKERVWLLSDQNSYSSDEEDNDSSAYYLAASDPTERFLELNSNSPHLSTLVLHKNVPQDSDSLKFRAIIGTLKQLPALRSLSLSGLSANSFSNLALNALPPGIRSLRLEGLPGIDDKGLQRFFASHMTIAIETLSLIDIEIKDLVTISTVLSAKSINLRSFSLVQQRAFVPPTRTPLPDLSARNLRQIHWEIRSNAGPTLVRPVSSSSNAPEEHIFSFTNPQPISCLATALIAACIRNGNFPSLRKIRIPHDPQGLIQALCKPLPTALLPCDLPVLGSGTHQLNLNYFSNYYNNYDLAPAKPRDSGIGLSLGSPTDSTAGLPALSNTAVLTPVHSRFAAQARILAAQETTFMTFRVYDPDNDLKAEKIVHGFVGQVGSPIKYDLNVDRGRGVCIDHSARSEWITNVEDLQEDAGVERPARSWRRCRHQDGGKVGTRSVILDELFR